MAEMKNLRNELIRKEKLHTFEQKAGIRMDEGGASSGCLSFSRSLTSSLRSA